MQVIVEHGNQSLQALSGSDKVIVSDLMDKYLQELCAHWVLSGEPWACVTPDLMAVSLEYMYSIPQFYLLRDKLSDKPVGFILYNEEITPSNHLTVDVCEFYILDTYRGKGYGKQLLSLVVEYARSRGAVGVSLNSAESNPANNLYDTIGFRPVSTRKVLAL